MKLRHLILLLFLSSTIFAQSKTELQVADAVTQLKNAMVARDASTLENMTSDLLTYGHSSGVIEDKAEFIRKVTNGESSFTEINLSDQWIRISGKTATVRHLLDAKTSINGTAGTIKLKVLLVFVKEKGGWKLLARQAVR